METELIKELKLHTYTDDRGSLSVIEGEDTVPFEIKRIFLTYAPSLGSYRGGHANKTANFAMVNITGSCDLYICDPYRNETISLTKPMECVLLPAMTWKEISNYSPDSVVMFLSDQHYNRNDYYYDYSQYIAEAKKIKKY